MRTKYLAQPCRNYAFLGKVLISSDPKDGREKYVLATTSAGGTGRIIFIDTVSGEGESIAFPSDHSAWALYYLEESGELLVGTCPEYGYLHRLDLKTRTWIDSQRLEGETYFWNFARAKDGCVYGSNWPGCILYKYDPKTQKLTSAGRVCEEEDNHYSRHIYTAADGNIVGSAGYAVKKLYHFDVEKQEFKSFGENGDCILGVGEDYIFAENGDNYKFYDPYTLELMEPPIAKNALDDLSMIQHETVKAKLELIKNPPYVDKIPGGYGGDFRKLADGRVIGIERQEYIMIDGDNAEIRPIPADPPPTGIMTLTIDADGVIWGAASFGQTIFSYDPKTGEYKNTPQVTRAGGEVYGMCFKDEKLFLSAYVGGDHIVYDPKQPWNQRENINPRSLEPVRPHMTRPMGWSVIGPDGNFFTGWCAHYGTYGGGISRIDTKTYEMKYWYPMIPQQSICSIASGKDHLYAVTSGHTSGLTSREDQFYLLKLDCDGNIVWKKQYELGITFHKMLVCNGYILASYHNKHRNTAGIFVYSEDTLEELSPIELGDCIIRYMLSYSDDTVVVFTNERACLMRVPTGEILQECAIENGVFAAVKGKDGEVYYSIETKLYKLEF